MAARTKLIHSEGTMVLGRLEWGACRRACAVLVLLWAVALPGCVIGRISDSLEEANASMASIERRLEVLEPLRRSLVSLEDELMALRAELVTLHAELGAVEAEMVMVRGSMGRLDAHLASVRQTLRNIDGAVPFVDVADDAVIDGNGKVQR